MQQLRRWPKEGLVWAMVALAVPSCTSPGGHATTVRDAAERLSLEVCTPDGVPEPILCGTIDVPLDRANSGQTHQVYFVVIPALDGNPSGQAWTEHPGGPGRALVQQARLFAVGGDLERFRAHRDVLLMDQRGVGASGALACAALSKPRVLEPYFSRERVQACRDEMDALGVDLRHYSTIDAVDDLEAIRDSLGFQQLDLGGWSYGSKFMLTYAHRYPDRVRSIAVFVPTIANYRRPIDWPRFTEAALEGMFADCAAELACAAAYPDLRGDLDRLAAALDRDPVEIEYVHPETGARVAAVVDRARLADEVHSGLLRVPRLQRLPGWIHAASRGDFEPFLSEVVPAAVADQPPLEAMYLSVVCPEEVARIPAGASTGMEGTLVGTHFLDEFRMACEIWDLPPRAEYPLQWQTLDIPALIVAGDRDPITPVEYGEEIASGFRRARFLPIPRMPHHTGGLMGSECLDDILFRFVENPDPELLDTSCVANMLPRPFLVDTVTK